MPSMPDHYVRVYVYADLAADVLDFTTHQAPNAAMVGMADPYRPMTCSYQLVDNVAGQPPSLDGMLQFNVLDGWGLSFVICDIGSSKILSSTTKGAPSGTVELSMYPASSGTETAGGAPPFDLQGVNLPAQTPAATGIRAWPSITGTVNLNSVQLDTPFGKDLAGSMQYPTYNVIFDEIGGQQATFPTSPSIFHWETSVITLRRHVTSGSTMPAAFRFSLKWTPADPDSGWAPPSLNTFRVDPEMIVRPGT